METIEVEGVECVLVDWQTKGNAISSVARNLRLPDRYACSLCPLLIPDSDGPCEPCAAGDGSVFVEARYWPIIQMRSVK